MWFRDECILIVLIHIFISIRLKTNFHEIYEEVVSITAEYYKFGIGLRLKSGELQAIRKSCGQDIDQAFADVLLVWLRQ